MVGRAVSRRRRENICPIDLCWERSAALRKGRIVSLQLAPGLDSMCLKPDGGRRDLELPTSHRFCTHAEAGLSGGLGP